MKYRMWFPNLHDNNGQNVAFVYAAATTSNDYYYAYNPLGIYHHMNPKEWHGPFRLLDERNNDAFEGCTEVVLCRGAALKRLHSLGFKVDGFHQGE